MRAFWNKYVLWFAAASCSAGAAVLGLGFSTLTAQPVRILGALVLAMLVLGAVRLAINAIGAKHSNVLEHAPEMSSLSFPPSSIRK